MYISKEKEEQFAPINMGAEEFFQIARKLEEFNSVFSTLWRMGAPIMTTSYGGSSISTAEVHFDSENKAIKIYINPFLWKRLNEIQKFFIICHECLHVVFNYGFRVQSLENKNAANIAADAAINQILERNFMFPRKEIDPEDELCWHDNGVLALIPNVELMQTMEYYYNLLDNIDEISAPGQFVPGGNGMPTPFFVGNHFNMLYEESEMTEEFCKKMNETLSEQEKKSIQQMIEQHFREIEQYDGQPLPPGTSPGNVWVFIEKTQIKHKRKWETVIKRWANFQVKEERKDVDQWTVVNKRFVLLPRKLIIPSEMEIDEREKDKKKIEVWFFQDTSGSCAGFAKRFFKAAESLPPKRFDVKMHCFDTAIYETTLQSRKLYGFGGTSFRIIEDYIIRNTQTKYPKAVFVITDGAADQVNPKYPERWYWFLSQDCTYCIPKESNIYFLKDFE